MTPEEQQRETEMVLGKLAAEGLTIESPLGEIEACLSKTVQPTRCIKVAQKLKGETK